jgi:hypothetical protein
LQTFYQMNFYISKKYFNIDTKINKQPIPEEFENKKTTSTVKYGLCGRSGMGSIYQTQNVFLSGARGKIRCICDNVEQLNFEVENIDYSHFTIEHDGANPYATFLTFKLNGDKIHVAQLYPKDLRIEYDNNLECRTQRFNFKKRYISLIS